MFAWAEVIDVGAAGPFSRAHTTLPSREWQPKHDQHSHTCGQTYVSRFNVRISISTQELTAKTRIVQISNAG